MNMMGPIFDKALRMGNAYLLIGPPNVAFDDVPNWNDVGAVAGPATVHPTPKAKELGGGSPVLVGAVERESDGYSVEIELYEVTLANIIRKYGLDGQIVSATGGQSVSVAAEGKLLYGYNWFHLQHANLTSTVVSGQLPGATPVTLVEGVDFQVDRLRGLVRRLRGTAIPEGIRVTFGYTCTSAAQGINTYSRGASRTIPKYALKLCVPMTETERLVFNGYKAYPDNADALSFAPNDYHKMKLVLKGMQDFTRALDDCLYSWTEEVYYLADTPSSSGGGGGSSVSTVTLQSSVPSEGVSGVSASTAPITATFSGALNPSSVTDSNVWLHRDGETLHLGATLSYDSGTKTITLTPTSSLGAGSVHYTLELQGLLDASGKTLASTAVHFTTA